MRIVAVCGVGMGSSAILKLNAERALARLELSADVSASDIDSVAVAAADAQIILTSPELRDRLGATSAEVIVVENYFDLDEVTTKIEAALA